ncbi:MAG: hypothetical protein HOV81_31435 [Kofleriaceae bacterium]|nr:hypothetical protein [Kofleriaceae bacterium]
MKLVTTTLVLAVAGTAHAGGLQRPNGISARGVGMGGAFVAFADDATAIYFNPAALDAMAPEIMVGGELVYGPRTYTPIGGPDQSTTIVAPVPSIGLVGRLGDSDRPSRLTFGLGVFNTFGGDVTYDKTGNPALDATRDIVIELDGSVALHVSDRFSVGAGIRLGLGLFHVESTMLPFDATLSANGVGAGMSLSALVRPTDRLRIGLAWHSPLNVTTKGTGEFDFSGVPTTDTIEHEQHWPQWASLGVGYQATQDLRLAAQVDWTQWSNTDEITVVFPAGALPDQIYPEYWRDSWTVRAGGEYAISPLAALRAGAYFDQYAVPDQSLERQYLDSNKVGVSAGASFHASQWRFDMAVDGIVPSTRTVENNAAEVMNFTPLVNKAPGDHRGTLITFELAAARQF